MEERIPQHLPSMGFHGSPCHKIPLVSLSTPPGISSEFLSRVFRSPSVTSEFIQHTMFAGHEAFTFSFCSEGIWRL